VPKILVHWHNWSLAYAVGSMAADFRPTAQRWIAPARDPLVVRF
jgi:hypothetical protein